MADNWRKLFDRCPKCGKTHIFTPKSCSCGYDFERNVERKEHQLICPKDSTHLKLEWHECPECKTPLNELFSYKCPKCGEMVGIKDKYCKCGEKLYTEVIKCPYCRNQIDAESIVCPKCGRNLYAPESQNAPTYEYYCPRCGYKLAHSAADCPICSSQSYY